MEAAARELLRRNNVRKSLNSRKFRPECWDCLSPTCLFPNLNRWPKNGGLWIRSASKPFAKSFRKPRSPINTPKRGRNPMTPNFIRKKRIEQLYNDPPQDGRVICVDEFGPLSIQPYPGKGWFPQKKPDRLPATYTRKHGVRHLFA